MRVRLYLERKHWKRMELLSQQMVEDHPELVFGWVNWAYALRERSLNEKAKAVAIDALDEHPDEAVLWFNLACYCSLLGEVEESSQHLNKAVSLEKSFETAAVDDPDLDNLWKWIRKEN